MATFSEIPFEVFISALLPYLSVADVGMLAQVDTMWRDFIENPLVWKTLYLHLTPGKILDTSVHIGPKSARRRDHDREYQIYRNTGVLTLHYLSGEPFVPQSTNRCKGSKWFLNHTWCCDCMPKDLKNTLKSWREIRTDGIQSDDFVRNQVYPNTYNTAAYCSYVRTHSAYAMKKSKTKLDRLDNLLDLLLQDMDPEILDAASRAERQRIASLIELKEGPGRFL